MVYNWLTHAFGLRVPLNEMGAFDLWAWQLWWLVGLWLGVHWANSDLHFDRWAKKRAVLVSATVIAIGFITLRYVQLTTDLDFGKFAPLFDKWEFGVARIVDFTAVAAIAIRFRSLLKPLAIRPLVMLGQASLPVFCVHLLCVFFALTIMGNNANAYRLAGGGPGGGEFYCSAGHRYRCEPASSESRGKPGCSNGEFTSGEAARLKSARCSSQGLVAAKKPSRSDGFCCWQ